MRYLPLLFVIIVSGMLSSGLFLTGCSSGSISPINPVSEHDYALDTLSKAAQALEKGNLDECLKYFMNPVKNRKSLESIQNQWDMLAHAFKDGKIEKSDDDQIQIRLRLQRPDNPDKFIDSTIYLIKADNQKWLLSPVPVKRFDIKERHAAWGTLSAHGSYLTRAIVEYYIRNYPQDSLFTGPNGFLAPNAYTFPVVATHPGNIDTIAGLFSIDIYDNIPPEAILVRNAPTSLMQIGSIDEDVFLGEYNSSMNLQFNRDIWLDTSGGLKIKPSNDYTSDDDTFFKGYAHFLTPVNQNYLQNDFIGFNDMGILGDQTHYAAPAHEWGLGIKSIGPVNITGLPDMRQNWNRKTWQYAIEQYKDAMKTPDPFEKGKKLSDCFYALGHVMHLLQDCGIPAHVRNDMHGVPALHYVPGFSFLQPDPLEDWSDTFQASFINKTVDLWSELFFEFDPIIRYPDGFSPDEPLLHHYYNNAQITEHRGYETIFKSLAFQTNRTFVSENTIGRSTQGGYANTTSYPRITDWDFNYGGRTVLHGTADLPFYNEEHPLAVSTLWFDTWCTGFYTIRWRWPRLDEVVDKLSDDDGLFTCWDKWDEDFFTDNRKGVCETAWEVQFKRTVRHGAALLHEFYLEAHK